MDKRMDLIVKVNVDLLGSSVATTSINTMGILVSDSVQSGKAETAGKYYTSDEEVGVIFGTSSEAYKMAKRFFAQKHHPDKLYIGVCASKAESALESVMNDSKLSDVYVWVVSLDIEGTGILTQLKALNDYAQSNYKQVAVEFDVSDDVEDINGLFTGEGGLTVSQTDRLSIFAHDTTTNANDHIAVSIFAERCGKDPVRGTFAHKFISGDSAENLSKTLLQNALDVGYNVFCSIANSARVMMGTTSGNNKFIDSIFKGDWLKFRIGEKIFDLLQSGNDGEGIDYDQSGLDAVGAAVVDVLTTANKNHYIMDGFTVNVPNFEDIPSTDRAVRKLSGIVAEGDLMGSVHFVIPVNVNMKRN